MITKDVNIDGTFNVRLCCCESYNLLSESESDRPIMWIESQ
jgi:hypothetical protein